jgi:disulfide bond formation protein DsbB
MVFWDQYLVRGFSVLTILANVIFVIYLVDIIYRKSTGKMFLGGMWRHFNKWIISYVFLVSVLATGGSLLFSEVLNFTPCVLCWFQRIFMYPIVLLSGLAYFKKDRKIIFYVAAMALIGLLFASVHYMGQVNENTILPCNAVGYSASCSENFFKEFGYVTIPFMALSAFVLLIAAWHLNQREI